MKPFSSIAIPHRDILEGRFTMDVFAADLWEVFKGRAPEEYQDPTMFFRKTYITEGLRNLLDITEKRLEGKGGDPIIQLQTPFGGGKTHSLIALYHKVKGWGVNIVVLCGDKLPARLDKPTFWEETERQLTGEMKILKGKNTPGGEELIKLLEKYQPLLILMDEVHEYAVKSSGVKVEDSTLVTQTLAFLQELSGTIKTLNKALLVASLPSSNPYEDENSEKLLGALQSILGRMKKVYTPVHDDEISPVIRRRLFSNIEEEEAREVIEEFVDYAEREKILPEGVEKSTYRNKFMKSYPFQPEVIDVLYKRWGSFPDFQRTRGVLRVLSLVVYSLKDSQVPYIRLADLDLGNDEIKGELVRYIGPEYNSVIAQDVTSTDASAKKVDRSLPGTYSPYSLGTKVATAIFTYSFSTGPERGVTINEIKLSCTEPSIPSAIIADTVSKLSDPFISLYLDCRDGKYFFTSGITLPRILVRKMENISKDDIKLEERKLLPKCFVKEYFEIFLLPKTSKDIPDTKTFKLVVQQDQDIKKCGEFLENYGEHLRVYRNILIFLCPMDSERTNFEGFLKRKLAWQLIDKDKMLSLTSEQEKEVKNSIKRAEMEVNEHIRNLYRVVLLPSRDGFKEIDLGIPTYGADITIDKEIYERLRSEGEILEKLAPLSLKEKYLKDRDWVETKNILESFFNTPGEMRITSDEVLKNCIKEGVKQGLFGVGDIEDEKPVCRHFKADFSPELVEGEILIKAELCKLKEIISGEELQSYVKKIRETQTIKSLDKVAEEISSYGLSSEQRGKIENEIKRKRIELGGITPPPPPDKYRNINLKLNVPSGKLSDIVRIVSYIKSKFDQVNIRVEIFTQDGEIAISDYDDKIREAINQAGVGVEEEEVE